MPRPTDIPVIDLLVGIPAPDGKHAAYQRRKALLLDKESRERFEMPAQYMFKDIPNTGHHNDYVSWTIEHMDQFGIERAMIPVDDDNETTKAAAASYPDRFFLSYEADPNYGMDEVRKIMRLHAEFGIKAVTAFPCGIFPQTPINDKRWYPIYAKCVELDLPLVCNVGVPGPRVPFDAQKVERVDEVCWFFPELRFVMRHGGEPWTALAVKLMLKYPNLFYMTSAFAPKHYPRDIIDYANTRGADKIMYAGYFPMGLSLERIFRELDQVPFRDHVWRKFLHDNAEKVFRL